MPRDFNTSGIPLEPVYDAVEGAPLDLGEPGAFPFGRGVYPTMYRSRLWTMRQYAGFATAAESNARYRYLLEQGQTGLSVAFDLPTQLGYDSDAVQARGEVGKVGVAIDSIADMETLLDGIPLDRVSVSMTINAPASILLALLLAVARRRGIAFDKLSGTVQNDVLKEYVARGTYIYPPEPSMRLVTDLMAYCAREVPQWNTISISGYHIREAGSTAVEEIAFTLANGKAYLRAAREAGIDLDTIAPRLSFFWNAHNDFFEEVAKFRAARVLWAHITRDEFGCKDPRSQMLRFHTQTGGSTLTAQEPENNVVRVTLQALAAVLGGTQSLHTNGKDEALALPTAQSAKVALRTQQIIAYESGVTDVVDPLAGSYYVETLTDELVERARAAIAEVDEMGGSIAAIESGWMQARIADSAYAAQQAIERGEAIVVGVNKFAENAGGDAAIPLQRIDEHVARDQIERLREIRTKRDASAVARRLAGIRSAAAGRDNLMPHFVDAVDDGATLGEICDVLRDVFGTYRAKENRRVMTIDHVAIVVKDLDATLRLYVETLGFKEVYREVIYDQGVEAVGLKAGDSIIELLLPLDEGSPIAKYRGDAETRLHHTAYRVDDIEAKLAEYKAAGVRLIDDRPRKGAHGNLIAFLHPKSTGGVLIELCQRIR